MMCTRLHYSTLSSSCSQKELVPEVIRTIITDKVYFRRTLHVYLRKENKKKENVGEEWKGWFKCVNLFLPIFHFFTNIFMQHSSKTNSNAAATLFLEKLIMSTEVIKMGMRDRGNL